MSFVFLSHADADKDRVRHVVEALIAASLKVWLDNPAKMGFSKAEIDAHFHHLEAGSGQYRTSIDKGLREAGAVLVCWSETAKARSVVIAEATVGRALEKLVACRIDDVDPQTLPDGHGSEQIPDLRRDEPAPEGQGGLFGRKRVPRAPDQVATGLGLLVAAVKAKMQGAAAHAFEHRVKQRIRRDVFAPYLIDRMAQETSVGTGIDVVRAAGGVRPFLVAGPENECPDEFMVRLERYTSPRRLNDRAWYQVRVEWPVHCTPAQFGSEYRARLAPQLNLPSTAKVEEIGSSLAQRDRPVAVISLMRADEWQVDEPKRVEAWLKWWEKLSEGPVRFSAMPILCLKLPKAKPGWKLCPSGCSPGGSVSNQQIWRAAQRLQSSGGGAWPFRLFSRRKTEPRLHAPPVLHPIRMGDVDRWIGEQFEMLTADHDAAKGIIEKMFGSRSAQKHGVALDDFARAMRPLFDLQR